MIFSVQNIRWNGQILYDRIFRTPKKDIIIFSWEQLQQKVTIYLKKTHLVKNQVVKKKNLETIKKGSFILLQNLTLSTKRNLKGKNKKSG